MSDDNDKSRENVFSLFTRQNVNGTVAEETIQMDREGAIETLESVIEEMKKGDVTGFAMVLGQQDPHLPKGVVTTTATVFCNTALRYNELFIGGCERLKLKLLGFLEAEDYELE